MSNTDSNVNALTAEDQAYYDEDYFVNGAKTIIDANTGKKNTWGYKGTDWAGNYYILNGIMKILGGEVGSVLDVGAGQGSFTDYAIRLGLRAKGYDFSEYAVANPHNYAKGYLFQGDATDLPEPDESYDLIFCSDMLEHLPRSKVHKVVEEFKRIGRKWVFLQFPVVEPIERFNWEKDGKEHKLYSHFMIAGHLNMELRQWWDKLFTEYGFKIRDDLVLNFRDKTPREVLVNWANIVILEK